MPRKKKPETILLVDADILCFRAAAAVEKRTVIVKHLKTGQEKEFTTRTEFRKSLKERFGEDWKSKEPRYSYEDVQTAESLSAPLHNIKARLHLFKEKFPGCKIELYLGGGKNFRNDLPLPKPYKGTREYSLKPVYLQEVRDYTRTVHKAVDVEALGLNIECDDMLSVRAYEELAEGNNPIISSMDKDTYQADGISVYNHVEENAEVVKIPLLGELVDHGKKGIKGTGFMFFAFQLLFGDTVDTYHPTDILDIRYGEKSAYNDLKDCKTTAEVADKVVAKYKEWFPGEVVYTSWDGKEIKTDWQGMLDTYFKCAYMLRSKDDKTTWQEFFKERGWNGMATD